MFARSFAPSERFPGAARALVLLGLFCSSSSLLACERASAEGQQESAPSVAVAQPTTATPAAAAAPSSAASAQPSYREEAFELSLSAPSSAKVADEVEVVVTLKAQAGYKVNPEYPIKFTFEPGAGAVPTLAVLKKEQGKIEKASAELRGKLKLSKAGKQSIAGRLSFSVCTDERCLIEKRDLVVSLDVS